jgi:hypothetical protein
MRLPIPRAFVRPAILLAVTTGFTTAALPLTATAAGSAPSAVIHPATDVGMASQVSNATASSGGGGATQPRGVRQLPRSARAAAARLAQVPTAGSADAANAQSSSDSGSSGQLLQHFNGVSSLDSQLTNFQLKFEPPDQGLCEGNGFVLEAVNSAYTIYRKNGKAIAGPFNVNDLFHRGGLEFTSDPRCYYDPTTNTWFAIILFIATNPDGSFGNSSAIDISVNTSGDPTRAWTTYRIDTTHAKAPATSECPCFGDQPRIGIDAFNLYLSTDEFSINGSAKAYGGAQLYAVAKQDLVGLKRHIHFAHFDNPTIDGNQLFAIEPAITTGPAAAEYFLNALDLDRTSANHIGVWAMTNRDEVGRGKAPTLSSVVIGSETYGFPPPAVQRGSTSTLDSGDDRMQQVQFINGTIWGELDTALTIPGDSAVRTAGAWFKVKPSLADEEIGSATMTSQGYVALRGNYVLYPALQADQAGNAAMVFTVSGQGRFPSAAFATMRSDQSALSRVTVAAAGTGPYDPNATRWGDYSWAQLDPKSDTFWLATEYIPPPSSQTTTRERNWGTEVLQVKIGGDQQN